MSEFNLWRIQNATCGNCKWFDGPKKPCLHPSRKELPGTFFAGGEANMGCLKSWEPKFRCNKCNRPMKGSTAYDGACECGGLIENEPKPKTKHSAFFEFKKEK